MKRYLFVLLMIISSISFSQKGDVYFSYPEKGLKLVLYEKYFESNSTKTHIFKTKVYKHKFKQQGDTLFLKKGGYAVIKDDYLDLRIPGQLEIGCSVLFRMESEAFDKDRERILEQCKRSKYHYDIIFELYKRIKRIELFGEWCELDFPPLYDEHF